MRLCFVSEMLKLETLIFETLVNCSSSEALYVSKNIIPQFHCLLFSMTLWNFEFGGDMAHEMTLWNFEFGGIWLMALASRSHRFIEIPPCWFSFFCQNDR